LDAAAVNDRTAERWGAADRGEYRQAVRGG